MVDRGDWSWERSTLDRNPRLSKAPTMRLLPQVGFSWSSLTTSFSSAASTDGRPRGLVLGKVHFRSESEIVQGSHDALAAPGWIFLEQFDHEFFQRRIDGWSTEGIGPGKGPLFGDQDTEPTEGIGSDERGQFPKAASADELGFARQPDALGVGEALGFATELFQENAIFFLEVFDHSLLVSAHPAGDRDEQELELRRHRVENLSKVLVAQSSIWSRLNFLAVQATPQGFQSRLSSSAFFALNSASVKIPCIFNESRSSSMVITSLD